MKNHPINLVIPPGSRIMTIAFGETILANDDAVRSAFEKAEQQGTATITLCSQDGEGDVRKSTGLDVLRMLGTPIDLVYTALIADDTELANAMFRTTILEYFFAKIEATFLGDTIRFVHSENAHEGDEHIGCIVDGPIRSISLTPEFDTVYTSPGKAFIPACNIDGGTIRIPVTDDGNTTTMRVIEDLTSEMFDIIEDGIANANLEKSSPLTFNIIVNLGQFSIRRIDGDIQGEASVPVVAYVELVD